MPRIRSASQPACGELSDIDSVEIPPNQIVRIWGFDPVKDRIFEETLPQEKRGHRYFTPNDLYFYEKQVDLSGDEILGANGVEMFIHVAYREKKGIQPDLWIDHHRRTSHDS